MQYHFFIDETGDHGLTFIDPNFPLFLLAGCLFTDDELKKAEGKINGLKMEFFNTEEVILHSREIRKCEGAFQILFDLEIKKRFYEKVNAIMSEAKFAIIASGVDKEEHIKKYGKDAGNPYSISLSFIMERLIYCSDSSADSRVDIKIEKRGRREDAQLLEQYNRIKDSGTYFVNASRFKNRISDFDFVAKKENVIGLQIADLCAYPLARHVLNSEEPYIPFKIIQDKIYCNNAGEYRGFGLKVFP